MISKQNLKSRFKDCQDFLIYHLLKFLWGRPETTRGQNPHGDDVYIDLRDMERAVDFSWRSTPHSSLAEV